MPAAETHEAVTGRRTVDGNGRVFRAVPRYVHAFERAVFRARPAHWPPRTRNFLLISLAWGHG